MPVSAVHWRTAETFRGVSISMRDGVVLSADVYGPLDRRPVILERTPYGRHRADPADRRVGQAAPPPREEVAGCYVAAGFNYVIQDCRGTGSSEGVFDKYLQEAEDGEDSLAFILAAPWCDGRIAMVGHSYGASCQVSVAALGSGGLATIVADCGGFSDALASGVRQGGAFDLKQATWVVKQTIDELTRAGNVEAAARISNEPMLEWLRRGPWVTGHTPLGDSAPTRQASLSRFWQLGEEGAFWRRPGLYVDPIDGPLRRLSCLHVSSWHDTSLRSTIDNFLGSTNPGEPGSALIIGTWCHGARHSSRSGDVDFGIDALPEVGLGASLVELRTSWIKDRLANRPLAVPPVRYFEMGGGSGRRLSDGAIDYGGRWRSAECWPPADSTALQLVIDGGRLVAEGQARSAEQSFLSDPDDPVPTCGGAINSSTPVLQGGMFDQSALFPYGATADGTEAVPERGDMLMTISAPLDRDLALCGAISAELYVSADVPDADLTIKLVDCYPDDGPCLNLGDGILRLRYREGFAAPVPLPMDEPVRAVVVAYPTAALIKAGHRLRLDIAGSNFPHFDINPQTGGQQGQPGPRRRGRIVLHTGPAYPSRLNLVARPAAS